MAEPHALVLHPYKSSQKQRTDIRLAISDLSTDMRGAGGHQAGFKQGEVAQDGRIADLTLPLGRAEDRVELRDY